MAEATGNPAGKHLVDSVDDQYLLVLLADPEDLILPAPADEGQLQQAPLLDSWQELPLGLLDDKYARLLHLQEALFSSTAMAAPAVPATPRPPPDVGPSYVHHDVAGPSSPVETDVDVDVEPSCKLAFCDICAEAKPSPEMFPNPNCGHVFCKQCVRRYISTNLQENVTALRCLAAGCGGALEPVHCREILPADVFDRWGTAICESTFLGWRRFYCPFKDCSAPLLVDDGEGADVRESECPHCHRLFCAQCDVPWHAGVECVEFRRLAEDERGSQDMVVMGMAKSKSWKRCPSCRFYVEKVAGCLHITCRCGTEFCYGCGSTWNVSHTRCHT